MTMCNLHAFSRRELLSASGALFAWAYVPKMARAEGRDPRLLVVVLPGARSMDTPQWHRSATPTG
jgi:uncharacterized protein (DUF1501 family)